MFCTSLGCERPILCKGVCSKCYADLPESRRNACAKQKRYRERNAAKVKACKALSRKKHAESNRTSASNRYAKSHGAAGRHNKADRENVLALYNRQCANCGAGSSLEIDHIAPIAHGGANWAGNLQVLCMLCNTSKNDFRIQFFLPWDGVAPRIWEECELPLLDDCDIVRV